MNNIKVSVIIPVYNGEKYLQKCLDSVVNQTLKDIEVICVDDGSTDGSPEILNSYSKKDERIKVINQKNKDVGAARGAGLKIAKGEYVAFVDNDDWLVLDALQKLYDNAKSNGSELVLFKVSYFFSSDDVVNPSSFKFNKYFKDDVDFDNFTFNALNVKPEVMNNLFAPWFKFYKRSFLNTHDFYFKENITYPDVPLHVQVMLRAEKISFLNESLYFYRREHSESMLLISSKSRRSFDIFTVIDEVKKFLSENNFMKTFENEFIKFKLQQINFWLFRIHEDYAQEFYERSKKEISLLKISDSATDSAITIEELPKKLSILYKSISNSETLGEMKCLKKLYENEQLFNKKMKKCLKQKELYLNKLKKKEEYINSIESSISWKITKPLRKVRNFRRR